MAEYSLVVLGSGGVGKTALTVQLTQSIFEEEYNPTIYEVYQKDVVVDGKKFKIEILDMAGQEGYEVLRGQHIKKGKGFLLVYDITSKSSFQEISTFAEEIVRTHDAEDYPCVLVGNKCDLSADRAVSTEEAESFAEEQDWPFFETSAKDRINVDESFEELVSITHEYHTS
eukprot:gb/GECH01000030.1/.p1 GENE.gb/GECH01000030.1/~~gb/GECH01000030.1/.p1  ORF type:complete len:171 (+),score=39.32 gb/GECH01000030.1/:1-513(+)